MRLRQIALVAETLKPAVDDITAILGLEVAYRDPRVSYFGLENAVMPISGNFLEVVAPVKDDTTAGRYLDRRGGNGGYMVILQCDDALAQRKRITSLGIRSVLNIDNPEYRATHFHPGDTGNLLLSVDSVKPGDDYTDPVCMWEPAGPAWQDAIRTGTISEMLGAQLQSGNPAELASLWSTILGLEARESGSGEWQILLQNGLLRFVPDIDGRGTGVGGIDLKTVDRDRLLDAAGERGCLVSDNRVIICGTRFNLY